MREVRIGDFCGFIQLDAEVPLRSYGIVTEQARLVKMVKVILGLAFIIRYDQTVGVAMGRPIVISLQTGSLAGCLMQ
jgi:hypothetical protein